MSLIYSNSLCSLCLKNTNDNESAYLERICSDRRHSFVYKFKLFDEFISSIVQIKREKCRSAVLILHEALKHFEQYEYYLICYFKMHYVIV